MVQDVENFDWSNTDEIKVLRSNYISAYKGKIVIRTPNGRSGSLGILMISRDTATRVDSADVIRHEYGHTFQLEQLGLVRYLAFIGIPSITNDDPNEIYFRQKWEITADFFGEVESREYSVYDLAAGFEYLDFAREFLR